LSSTVKYKIFKPLLEDGDQQVNGERRPDLGLDGVLGGTVKGLDAKMLFDPGEEQFHTPTGD
jgi:hypothetical protein